jgi:hypothetical protein
MKERNNGFLSPQHIDQEGEIFDYIAELHDYLWRFVRVQRPGASGNLRNFLDEALNKAEGNIEEDIVTYTPELAISGNLYLTFFDIEEEEIEDPILIREIIEKLQSSEYVISLNDKRVMRLDNLYEAIYTFQFEVGDSTDYTWELIED